MGPLAGLATRDVPVRNKKAWHVGGPRLPCGAPGVEAKLAPAPRGPSASVPLLLGCPLRGGEGPGCCVSLASPCATGREALLRA